MRVYPTPISQSPIDEPLDFSLSDTAELPDIELSFDDSIPYDEVTTDQLLETFAEEDAQPIIREQPSIPEPVIQEEAIVTSSPEPGADEVAVQKGDMLWNIANQNKASGIGINQAMISILRANPDAFVDGNINNLKSGVVLRIPDRNEMLSVSRSVALEQARRQNALWREYRQRLAGSPIIDAPATDTSLTIDSTDIDTPSIAEETAAETGELAILAPGAEDSGGDRASGTQEGQPDGVIDENNLLLSKESLAAIELEKADLQNRLDIKLEELDQANSLLNAKNEQLALLQARLQEIDGLPGEAANDEVLEEVVEEQPSAELESPTASEDNIDDLSTESNELTLEEELASETSSISLDGDSNLIEEQPDEIQLDADVDSLVDDSTLPDVDEPTEQSSVEPVEEEPSIELPPRQEDKYAFVYKYLPPPLDGIMKGLVDSYGPIAALAAPLLILLLLIYVIAKRLGGSREPAMPVVVDDDEVDQNEPSLEDMESTVIINQQVVEDKPSLLDKIKALFKKKEKPADKTAETDELAEVQGELDEDDDVTGEYEGDLPETTGAFDPVVDEAAASVEESANSGEIDSDKTSQFLAVDADSEEFAAVEPDADDTTAEADVYLAYGLFDQAEDLLKEALAANPEKAEYNAKLLETYFAAGKKDEFESLAGNFKQSHAQQNSILWTKVVAMGQELLPGNEIFAGESSGLKAADFVPSKPVSADIDVGDADDEVTPDFDIGEATSSGTDIDVSETMHAASETIDNFDETIIAPGGSLDELDIAAEEPVEAEATVASDADVDLDFNADELDLGDDINLEDELSASLDEELDETFSGLDSDDEELLDATDFDIDETDLDLEEGGLDVDADSLDLDSVSADVAEADTDDDGLDIEVGGLEDSDAIDLDIDAGDADAISLDDGDLDADLDISDQIVEELSAFEDDNDDTDVGEETIISDDLTEIDFGDSEDLADIAAAGADEGLDLDSDIADIAVDDEVETKLDLARAFLDMGDSEGAKSSLQEVLEEGSDKQKQEAQTLLQKIA